MRSAEREALAERALALTAADDADVLVLASDERLTRFTHDAIHQNVAERDVRVRVRAVVGRRVGVAETNAGDDASLRAAAARAVALAHVAPSDDAFPGLPEARPAPHAAHAFAAATAEATPETRGNYARAVFTVAEREGLWPAGYVSTSTAGITVASSRGVLASFDGTAAALNVKQNGPDSTGFAERYDVDVRRIDARALAQVAAAKATRARAPVAADAGRWTVILEPAAVGELLSSLVDHFSARAYDEGSSFLSGGLDRRYAGDNVTLRDDCAHPLAPGMPFDFEGVPRGRIVLVEGGIGRAIVTDSRWAAKLGHENTGHALPAPDADGPQPRNLVLDPGSKPLEQLIAETERGLLVSRFWYIRTVDRRKTIVTGMTRDGTFAIERGKIVRGVKNMRFNQSILEALSDAEFSAEQARTAGYSYTMVVPAAKCRSFRFDSVTEF